MLILVTGEEKMAKTHYSGQGRAGIKLLVTAVRRNVERVENRYRNKQTREVCQSLSALCDGIWEALEEDRPFTLYLGKQLPLQFVFGEDGGAEEPFADPFEYTPAYNDLARSIHKQDAGGDVEDVHESHDGYPITDEDWERGREWIKRYADNDNDYSRED